MSIGGEDVDQPGRTPPAVRPHAVLAGAVALMVLVLLVLAAAATGGWVRRPLTGEGWSADPVTPSRPSEPAETISLATVEPSTSEPPGENPVLRWVLIGLGVLVAVVLALVVVRLLIGLLRRPAPPPATSLVITGVTESPEVDAPTIRDGIAQARSILDSDLVAPDAILQAWLALERAAASAGMARTRAQTPTEFTAVVLERTPAQRDAVALLCRLYLRVRFSDDEVGPDDGERARHALEEIAASWAAVGVPE